MNWKYLSGVLVLTIASAVAILVRSPKLSILDQSEFLSTITDASGVSLAHFFDGLPVPVGKRPKVPHGHMMLSPCERSKSSLMEALGLGVVAYAQTQCTIGTCTGGAGDCGFARVSSAVCNECGSGSGNVWSTDFMLPTTGYKRMDSPKCGSDGCGCQIHECTCGFF